MYIISAISPIIIIKKKLIKIRFHMPPPPPPFKGLKPQTFGIIFDFIFFNGDSFSVIFVKTIKNMILIPM